MPVEIKDVDRAFYAECLADFLPERIIDVHTHVWLGSFYDQTIGVSRSALWPRMVAYDNPIDDLLEAYRLMLPRQTVTPLIFGMPERDIALDKTNNYAAQVARERGLSALLVSTPEWPAAELERLVAAGGFRGLKPYLNFAPAHISAADITIFDFLPHSQLEVADEHGWIVMLHVPRPARLKDPVNLAQMLEIERRYPDVRLVIPHIGRAYCDSDVGDAFEVLRPSERMMFDFSANTNALVFERFLRAFGPQRVMFGSDMPILRMRTRRICEDGFYVNLVPPGLYGDVSGDPHMREVSAEEGERLSFFLYEELLAIRQAAEAVGLSRTDVEAIFFGNAERLIAGATPQLHMIWPERLLGMLPEAVLPAGYALRTYLPGDQAEYMALMAASGLPVTVETVEWSLQHALPDGFFVAIEGATGRLVATAQADHAPAPLYPCGGELGWAATHPDHRGRGLGRAVCAAATARLLQAGYRRIYLQTESERLAALKTYLRLGYEPFLYMPEMESRWRAVCGILRWPFTPDAWPRLEPH